MFNYQSKPTAEQTGVCLIDMRGHHPSLARDLLEAGDRYGFTAYLEPSETFLKHQISHVIIVDGPDDVEAIVKRHASVIAKSTSATIAIDYSSYATFEFAAEIIGRMKSDLGNRLNFLLPSSVGERCIPSHQKLIDNSVCDTVRVKYVPQNLDPDYRLDQFDKADVTSFFREMSQLISKHELFHRSPTDGFISVRNPIGDGFFISATKTDKLAMDLSRVSLVERYCENSNTLAYRGRYLPSSDSVECAIMYQEMPSVNAVLHIHGSKAFTRNLDYQDYRYIPPSSYGDPSLGHELVGAILSNSWPEIIIMEDHGEVICSRSDNPQTCAREIVQTVESLLNAHA